MSKERIRVAFSLPRPRLGWLARLLPAPGTVVFTVLVITGLLWAQSAGALPLPAPMNAGGTTGTIPYQGRLANANGQPLTETMNMIFRLYTASSGGAPIWEEQWTGSNSVQVSDGLFNVMLGSLTSIPQSIIASNTNLFLGITVGTDSEMVPRVQLGSVPFAVQALTVPDASVTTGKIADGAVTLAKLGPDVSSGVPRGTIVMWSGSVASIPSGWALCDGNNGTPNLLDRFVLSVTAGQDPGETGGSNAKTLSASNLPAHTHSFTTSSDGRHSHSTHIEDDGGFSSGSNKSGADDTSGNGISTTSDGSHSHSGTTNATGDGAAFDIRPSYYRLAFIMKL